MHRLLLLSRKLDNRGAAAARDMGFGLLLVSLEDGSGEDDFLAWDAEIAPMLGEAGSILELLRWRAAGAG